MNGDEVVWGCLRKHGSDEEGRRCLQCCGADEELQEILREGDAEETQIRARQVLRKFAVDEAMEKARRSKAALDSIAESSLWKDPQFLTALSQHFIAKDLEKSRETTKHYIDSAKPPATGPKSRMGIPKRGTDGRVIWEPNTDQQSNPTDVNLRNAKENSGQDCGHCIFHRNQDSTCQIVGGPVSVNLICDKFTVKPMLEQGVLGVQRKNVTADGKIDPTKSIMGNPKRNPDGSITWT